MSGSHELDVAIIGGGLAGNLLARQLRRGQPELRVGLLTFGTDESDPERGFIVSIQE